MLKINHREKNTEEEISADEGLLKILKPLLLFMDTCHYLFLFLCVSVWLCGCRHTWAQVPMEIPKVVRSSVAWSQAVCELLRVGAEI